MDEIREVEIELKRLREDAAHQKKVAGELKKENALLKSRNEYLVNKLKEASYVVLSKHFLSLKIHPDSIEIRTL